MTGRETDRNVPTHGDDADTQPLNRVNLSPADDESLLGLTRLAVPRLADGCVIDVLRDGRLERLTAAFADPEVDAVAAEIGRRYPTLPPDITGFDTVLRTGEAVEFPSVADSMLQAMARDEEHLELLRRLGLRSAIIVPIQARGHVFGTITLLATSGEQRYGAEDATFARELGHRAGLLVDNARLYREARQARQETEAARRRATTILESITDQFFALDREWRFTYVNRRVEEFVGRSRDELLGKVVWDVFPELVGSKLEREYRRAMAEQRPATFEAPSMAAPGHWLEVRAYPAPGGLSVYLQDITSRKRAEAALRESEKYFRSIIENISDIITILDLEGTARYISPSARRILGYSPEEILGRDIFGFVHPEDQDRVTAAVQDLLHRQRSLPRMELRFRRRDGSWCTLEAVGKVHRRAEDVRGLVIVARDITERKEAAAELKVQKAYLEELFESAPEGIVILDRTDRILRANDEFVRMFGYPRAELLGRKVNELIVPDDLVEESIAFTERALRGERVNVETVRRRRDGTLLHVSILAVPIRVAQGEAHVYGIYRNITERKELEQALRQREARYRSLFRNNPNAVYSFDLEGRFLTANPACEFITGYSVDDLIGSTFHPLIAPEELEKTREHFERAAAGEPQNYEVTVFHKDGHRIMLNVTNLPIIVGGEVVGVYGIAQDVSERKKLEEQLRQSQKMEAVGRLAGGIAHDFNNILTAVQGHAQLLLDDLPEGSPLRADLEEIHSGADRAADLTRQLLAFSRKQVMRPKLLDVNRVVSEMERMLRRLIGEDIELVTRLSTEPVWVKADPGQLEQVIMNLAVNARDAMPEGGRLTLETRTAELDEDYARQHEDVEPGRYVLLSMSDTGTGMDEATRERIFEPFFTTKEQGKGTGLGLSTVYGIVKQSGGHVWVYSEVGEGTTFKVYLPEQRVSGGPRAEAEEDEGDPGGSETILLVEDEAAVRSLVEKILKRNGYTVLEAESGPEALRLAESHEGPVHLLITDVVMPGMGGRELAERMVRDQPNVRVLFMSGYTEDDVVRRGVVDACTDFLEKPFTPRALTRKIRELLADEST